MKIKQCFVGFRPAIVFVHGDLSWDKLHLMISRSTTPDLVKMASKLEEFFYQQFHSSKRVLSAFGPIPGANRKSRSSKNSSDEGEVIMRKIGQYLKKSVSSHGSMDC